MVLSLEIADAVTAELAAAPAGVFNLEFTPVRRVLPSFDLAELAELQVSIVPRSAQTTGASRSLAQHDIQIDIGIQQKLPAGSKQPDADVAPLLELVERIGMYLQRRPLTGLPWAVWVRSANDPLYAPEHLTEQRVFTSVLTLTYRALQ